MTSLVDAIDSPYARAREQVEAAPGGLAHQLVGLTAAAVLPNLRNAAGRFQATLSQRLMARVALALRLQAVSTGALPGSLASISEAAADDPFAGGRLRYERRADGSALLELPGADALYAEMAHVANSCPFVWEIAPPAPPHPTP